MNMGVKLFVLEWSNLAKKLDWSRLDNIYLNIAGNKRGPHNLSPDCGLSSEGKSERRRFRSRIVGGSETSEGEIPWQVDSAISY